MVYVFKKSNLVERERGRGGQRERERERERERAGCFIELYSWCHVCSLCSSMFKNTFHMNPCVCQWYMSMAFLSYSSAFYLSYMISYLMAINNTNGLTCTVHIVKIIFNIHCETRYHINWHTLFNNLYSKYSWSYWGCTTNTHLHI